MKSDSKVLTVFPKARYVASERRVKMIGTNGIMLNISDEQARYILWNIIEKYGFGKQYV